MIYLSNFFLTNYFFGFLEFRFFNTFGEMRLFSDVTWRDTKFVYHDQILAPLINLHDERNMLVISEMTLHWFYSVPSIQTLQKKLHVFSMVFFLMIFGVLWFENKIFLGTKLASWTFKLISPFITLIISEHLGKIVGSRNTFPQIMESILFLQINSLSLHFQNLYTKRGLVV